MSGALAPLGPLKEVGSRGAGKARFAAQPPGCNRPGSRGVSGVPTVGSMGRIRLELTANTVSCTPKGRNCPAAW